MDLTLSDEQRLLINTVRRFVRQEIVPLEAEMDPDGFELPQADFERLSAMTKEMGLHNMSAPEEYGGAGLDVTAQALLHEEMSQHRAGLYTPCFGVFGAGGLAQLYAGTEEQKQKYLYPTLRGEKRGFFGLSEPSGGSDPARAIRTTAVRDGDEWVINGSKLWISGADTSDYGLLFTLTDASKGRNGITCFIVDTDTPGFQVRRIVHVLRSTHPPTELSFDNMRVPHANILGEEGGGFAIAWACTDDRLKVIAPFYASNPRPLAAVARACPIVGSYPDKDFTAQAGQKLDAALDRYNIHHDIKIYPNAKHSFFNDQGGSYNAAAAQDAWQRILGYFQEHIGHS